MSTEPLPRLLGEFRLDAVLGEGGSGVVYDAAWGPRRVALKVLHAGLAGTQRVRAQFLTEGQRLQALTHPGVVKVLGVGELPDGRPYLAMERLAGEALASTLARGPMPVARALALFGELCGAVGALHAQGLVHRDLKPENVFLVEGAHAVLLDFGIAKDLEAPASTTTMDGGVRGTPAYMAPERFFGQPAGVATDLYELALILYAMLAGRLPWDDLADPEARLSPRPLVELVSVPAELDIEIRRALSTRAQNRPVSAGALLAAVQAAAGARAAAGPEAGETARMGRAREIPVAPTVRPADHLTDPGTTPLAWAPVAPRPAVSVAPPARSRRARVVGALAAVGAVATGLAAWRLGASTPATAPSPAAGAPVVVPAPTLAATEDPWGARSATPAATITASGPAITAATARAELAAALPHLPADTSFVLGVSLGELTRDPRLRPLFDALEGNPQLAPLVAFAPPCLRALVGGAEWFALGAPGFASAEQGTLIVRGRWTRADVEGCFGGQATPRPQPDGAVVLELPSLGWLDFLDDHTAYLSLRTALTPAQVHASVIRGPAGPGPAGRVIGMTPSARARVRALPADRAITLVIDGAGALAWPRDLLPAGASAGLWARGTDAGLAFALGLDLVREADAVALAARIDAELRAVFAGAAPAVGAMHVERTRARVTVRGDLSTLMIGIVASALGK